MEYLIRVKANHDCWIADVEGDPGRTRLKQHALAFKGMTTANHYLEYLMKKYPNRAFSVEEA